MEIRLGVGVALILMGNHLISILVVGDLMTFWEAYSDLAMVQGGQEGVQIIKPR